MVFHDLFMKKNSFDSMHWFLYWFCVMCDNKDMRPNVNIFGVFYFLLPKRLGMPFSQEKSYAKCTEKVYQRYASVKIDFRNFVSTISTFWKIDRSQWRQNKGTNRNKPMNNNSRNCYEIEFVEFDYSWSHEQSNVMSFERTTWWFTLTVWSTTVMMRIVSLLILFNLYSISVLTDLI